jgi:metallo-beta-lactamase family protein
MQITFYGAAREVTGSMHLIKTESDGILLDCGMFQGRRKETEQKNRDFPFNTDSITNLVLSHAHIDHSGRIPLLTKNNYTGRVLCTRPTVDACGYLLPDSAHIQESDANYLNYKTVRSVLRSGYGNSNNSPNKKNRDNAIRALLKIEGNKLNIENIQKVIRENNLEYISPLYTSDDAVKALASFDGYPYRVPVEIGRGITCTFYEAGHILGSAVSIIKVEEKGRKFTVCYTGDIGRYDKPIIKNPNSSFAEEDRNVDLLVMESTYGNRVHEPIGDLLPRLKEVINDTAGRGGVIIVPSFAYGRTQELLYVLHELYDKGETPKLPVYVDSPLAANITKVFGEHPEVYSRETIDTFLSKGENPFSFEQVNFTSSVDESMALMRDDKPHIVITASGMCEAGRVLHHLRYRIHNPKNTILIVGFMAENTLGRRIQDQGLEYEQSGRKGEPPLLKFLNKEYPLKARVVKLGGFSAHGDKNEMMRFVKESGLKIKKIAVVHGEEEQALSFADLLRENGYSAFAPESGDTVKFN